MVIHMVMAVASRGPGDCYSISMVARSHGCSWTHGGQRVRRRSRVATVVHDDPDKELLTILQQSEIFPTELGWLVGATVVSSRGLIGALDGGDLRGEARVLP